MDYLRRAFRGEDERVAVTIDQRLLRPDPPDSEKCKEYIGMIIEARQTAISNGAHPKIVYLPDDMWDECKDKLRRVNRADRGDDSPLPDNPVLFGMIVRRGPDFKVE